MISEMPDQATAEPRGYFRNIFHDKNLITVNQQTNSDYLVSEEAGMWASIVSSGHHACL